MKTRLPCAVPILLAAALWAPYSRADDLDELRNLRDTTVSLVNLLVQQGVISRDKADAIIRQAQQAADKAAAKADSKAADQPTTATGDSTPAEVPAPAGAEAASAPAADSPTPAAAATNPSTADLINVLVEQGVISQDKADSLIEETKKNADAAAAGTAAEATQAAPSTATPPAPLRFSYTGEFDEVSTKLPANHAELDHIVESLHGAVIDQISVLGYTDNKPIKAVWHKDFPDNAALSRARAQAVADYLAAGLSLKPEQIEVIGKGEADPVDSNNSAEGRRKNRRVEVLVVAHHAGPALAAAVPVPVPVPAPEAKGTVHVQYVPEAVKQQILAQVKQDVLAQAKKERWGDPGTLPDWIYRITWAGDFRLRGESDLFPTDGAPNALPQVVNGTPYFYNMNNTKTTSNRLRILARFGMEARISDTISTGLRVATGGTGGGSNPGSENATLGNYDTRTSIGLDRAYIRYKPVSWVSVTGGRLGNPFFAPTDMVWAETLSLEGVVAKFSHDFNNNLDGILIAGAFPIQQRDNEVVTAGVSSESKWLFGYQTGLDWRFRRPDDLKFAVAFYDYRHVEGVLAPDVTNIGQYDWSAAGFRQKGNQTFDLHALLDQPTNVTPTEIGLVSKFRELNVSMSLDLGDFAPTHVILRGDFAKNIGFHSQEIESRTQITSQIVDPSVDPLRARVTGYQVKLVTGHDKIGVRGDWQVYSGYRYLERDAVLDAFNDQDFHLGGTNAKGYMLGGRYGLAKNTAVSLRWLSADAIDGPPLAIDVVQLDLTTSY